MIPWMLWNPLIVSLAVFLGSLALLLVVRKLLFAALSRWAAGTATRVDDLVVSNLRVPSLLWSLVLALYLAIGLSTLDPNAVFYAFRILHAVLILSITWVAANLAGLLIRGVVDRLAIEIPVTGLTVGMIKGTILIVGLLIFLSSQGIAITPILTALGIGGLAVALGLQETLANLFAGLHLLIEKPIRPGDFIKLESGEEGQVVDIGWRSTRIRMRPNNMIIMPNSKLAQSRIVNYYYPNKLMAVPIKVSVSYGTDPDRIERILIEEALAAANAVPGLLKEPSPNVQLIPGFGDSSLDFTLMVHVAEYNDQYPAQHEIRKRILHRFHQEGITIPYPQQVVHLHPQPGPSTEA